MNWNLFWKRSLWEFSFGSSWLHERVENNLWHLHRDYGRFAGYFFVCFVGSLRGLFFFCSMMRKKVSFINISRWRAFCARLIHEIWIPASSKSSEHESLMRNVEIDFLSHELWIFNETDSETRRGRKKSFKEIDHLAPNKRQIGWSNNHSARLNSF